MDPSLGVLVFTLVIFGDNSKVLLMHFMKAMPWGHVNWKNMGNMTVMTPTRNVTMHVIFLREIPSNLHIRLRCFNPPPQGNLMLPVGK